MASRFAEVDENGIIDLMFCCLFFVAKFSCLKALEWILHIKTWLAYNATFLDLIGLKRKRSKNFALDVINM